jgi:hypothetical protein
MSVTQISIGVDNTPGKLNEICEILEYAKINIKAIMASSVLKPNQLNIIVDDPVMAANVLKSNNLNVKTKEVIAVAAPDHPGGLNAILRPLLEGNVNVDTLYPFINLKGSEAILILEVDKVEIAKEVLKKHWVKTYSDEIYK